MLSVTPIPAFEDNYIWLLTKSGSSHAAVVDPGDAEVVLKVLEKKQLQLTDILITHRHADHTGGIKALRTVFPDCYVFGPNGDSIEGITHYVEHNQTITLLGHEFSILDIGGHTKIHLGYYQESVLFCGDTLFSAGCGRIFDGSAEQLFTSLNKISDLPDDTQIYCAHEYTLANLTFALNVEPNNAKLKDYYQLAKQKREKQIPTLPAMLGNEKAINPFLRTAEKSVKESAENYSGKSLSDEKQVFAEIRRWKDNF